MKAKMSWTMAALLFMAMLFGTIVLDVIFSPSLRHQFLSFHSDLWRFGIPGNVLADVILVVAMRIVYNRQKSCLSRTDLQKHPIQW